MIHVLYIDDEEIILELGKNYLEQQGGFKVDTTTSSTDALAQLAHTSYDAIVSDYMMPDMNGLDFLKIVRENNPSIPFIFFTGKGEEQVVIDAINNGADFYLKKDGGGTASLIQLSQMIKQGVARHSAEKKLKHKEEMFHTITDHTLDWEYWIDQNGRFVYITPSCEQITGYSYEEFYDNANLLNDLVAPEDREIWMAHTRLEDPDPDKKTLDMRIIQKDGSMRWINHSCLPVYGPNNTYRGRRVSNRDITDRKNTEARLQKERNNFLTIFRAAPVGLLLINKNVEITQANRIITDMVLKEPADIIRKRGGNGLGCIHSTEDPRGCGYSSSCPDCPLQNGIKTVLQKGDSVQNTIIPLTLNVEGKESLRWLNVSADPVEIEGESYAIVAIDDITEKHTIELLLRDSEQQYRSLFENMLEGFAYCRMIYDEEGSPTDWEYLQVNDAFEKHTGIPYAEGKLASDLFPELHTYSSEIFERYKRVVTSGIPESFESYYQPLDYWFQVSVYRPKEEHFILVFENISERKRSEHKIQIISRENQTILDNVPALIWYKDTNNNFVRVNQHGADHFGMPKEKIEGRSTYELFPDLAEKYYLDDLEVIRTKKPKMDIIEQMTLVSGEKRWVHTDKIPLFDDKGDAEGLIVFVLDITEKKRIDEALKISNKKLHLLSDITRHDILNQIQILLFYIETARSEAQDPTAQENIDKILQSVQNIERQISFTRDYQDMGIKAPLWQDVKALLVKSIRQVPLDPVKAIIDLPEVIIFADPLLEKAFYNLADNAKRYGEKITQVIYRTRKTDNGLIISIEDDGVGIPYEKKKGIFNREFYHHTGFGLNLSKEILSITSLTIAETGMPGVGARFEIFVPNGLFRIKNEQPQ